MPRNSEKKANPYENQKWSNKRVQGTRHKVSGPLTRDVVLIYMRGQAVRTTLNENVMASPHIASKPGRTIDEVDGHG